MYTANLNGNRNFVFPTFFAHVVMMAPSHPTNKLAMQESCLLPVAASSTMDGSLMNVQDLHRSKFGSDSLPEDMKEGHELLNTAIDDVGFNGKVTTSLYVFVDNYNNNNYRRD
ncbi:hypothetical protein TIFTF001_024237 [Ficus carica]|uniref:Uncharacterized protein n=1 Tax=Ficus carica TaxID=3494 RepID=A0AA88DEI4_FICCA|nr:hypothetical protein TIFTF001_024237 [Ficus carica]